MRFPAPRRPARHGVSSRALPRRPLPGEGPGGRRVLVRGHRSGWATRSTRRSLALARDRGAAPEVYGHAGGGARAAHGHHRFPGYGPARGVLGEPPQPGRRRGPARRRGAGAARGGDGPRFHALSIRDFPRALAGPAREAPGDCRTHGGGRAARRPGRVVEAVRESRCLPDPSKAPAPRGRAARSAAAVPAAVRMTSRERLRRAAACGPSIASPVSLYEFHPFGGSWAADEPLFRPLLEAQSRLGDAFVFVPAGCGDVRRSQRGSGGCRRRRRTVRTLDTPRGPLTSVSRRDPGHRHHLDDQAFRRDRGRTSSGSSSIPYAFHPPDLPAIRRIEDGDGRPRRARVQRRRPARQRGRPVRFRVLRRRPCWTTPASCARCSAGPPGTSRTWWTPWAPGSATRASVLGSRVLRCAAHESPARTSATSWSSAWRPSSSGCTPRATSRCSTATAGSTPCSSRSSKRGATPSSRSRCCPCPRPT
ncbi:MAG: hypothetical protein MZV70_37395 [Desulfobacterales bacterium]|nr:hypothetical protein [Desulfobacterales bacterium]